MGVSADTFDLEALRAGVREVLCDQASSARLHRFVDGEHPFDRELWTLAGELGWLSLAVPEAHGGMGLGSAETAVLCEELGRVLAPIPYVATLLATRALTLGGSGQQQAAWLPGIAAGELVVALASPLSHDEEAGVRVRRVGEQIVLDGAVVDVLDAAGADHLVLEARDAEGVEAWVVVEIDAAGITATAAPLWDRTHSLASFHLHQVSLTPDRILENRLPAGALRRIILVEAALALACEAMGGSMAIFEQVLEHLKTRHQFGKPIGSFQALKHRCADHKVAIEASGALVRETVSLHACGAQEIAMTALLAKAYACEVYADVAEDAVQLHGGIGVTWEHVCHLYLKRAKLDQALLDGPAGLYDRAAALLKAA